MDSKKRALPIQKLSIDQILGKRKKPKKENVISQFRGPYEFLSNFWRCEVPIPFEGKEYRTSEAAYQASKTLDESIREKIRLMPTARDTKNYGPSIKLRDDWDQVRIEMMYRIVNNKFEVDPELLNKLLATGDTYLIEGNTWGDTFWGQVNGKGTNHLGKVLMRVRKELREIYGNKQEC